jgi:hypothetical protein
MRLAAIVDAAIPHAIGAIPAQSICLGLPRSGNIGPEKVQREESRRRWDLRDGARINGLVMESQITADRRKPQANAASALLLLESLISSSIPTPPAMGLAEQRLA